MTIPAKLERALMLEAGYRCAVPTCRVVGPLEIEHIEDYAKVQKHEFHNMIVLCRNCHGMKGKGPRALDRTALKQLKANLGITNQRYNDTERRILEYFATNPETELISLPSTEVLYSYLIKDGLLAKSMEALDGTVVVEVDGTEYPVGSWTYELTETGKTFVEHLRDSLPVELTESS